MSGVHACKKNKNREYDEQPVKMRKYGGRVVECKGLQGSALWRALIQPTQRCKPKGARSHDDA
jgi:hypothetical protein